MPANGAADSQNLQQQSESNDQTKTASGANPENTAKAGDTSPPQSKNLNEIIQMAQKKGEQTRSSSTSLDNMAKFAWKRSVNIRQKIKKGLNSAYSVATGLTNPEVRKEVGKYINNLQPPNSPNSKK